MLAQHVVNQVGREQHLAPGLLLPGEPPRDQSGDDGAGAEGALHQRGFGKPGFQVVAQHVRIEQRVEIKPALPDHERHVPQPPHRQRVFIGDKSERTHPRPFHPPRQQHPERLMRQPPFEGIADEIVLVAAGKGFHQEFADAGDVRSIALQG